jgi:DNA-binding response OmpR family regulator
MRRDEHDRRSVTAQRQFLLQIGPGHPRQRHVEDQASCLADTIGCEKLLRSTNELVTKDELMQRVWPGTIVGDNALHVHISAIRKTLGRDRAIGSNTTNRAMARSSRTQTIH